jgi:hypothetical protein
LCFSYSNYVIFTGANTTEIAPACSYSETFFRLFLLQTRSNEELATALASDPDDKDFREAVTENVSVIKRKKNLLEELKKELKAHRSLMVTALGAAEARQLPAAIALETQRPSTSSGAPLSLPAERMNPNERQAVEEEEKVEGVYL